ncbi:cysteine desulfurase-like protein [Virgibacillus sp. W0181]|uniref:cysteine desulfurase-like protein n=1 Tax=Virgibacillus sp. W0181 TaxID=3391581 RepID=UPI003F476870
MNQHLFPIEQVRRQFPALNRTYNNNSVVYFDGPGGSQVAGTVIESMSEYMRSGVANLGGEYETGRETERIVDEARELSATLLGAHKDEIVFGANTTTIAFRIARALFREWNEEDGNIVVTELDHHANIDPWVTAADDRGLDIHKLPLDTSKLTLNTENLEDIITNNTKLVAIGLASNVIGTINNLEPIIKRAKEVGALVAIDAVHAVPHFAVDFKQLGADILFCSAYKFFGPHVGIAAINREVYENLQLFKLRPAPNDLPDKLETGTINFEGLVGVMEAIRVIAGFGEGETLREQLLSGYERMEAYENKLADRLREGLGKIENVIMYQAPDSVRKTPTVAFRVEGTGPEKVCRQMAGLGVHIEYGDFYAMTLVEKLELGSEGGLIRAGIAPYNTEEEIDRLIKGIEGLNK